jgi:hypothetical protein
MPNLQNVWFLGSDHALAFLILIQAIDMVLTLLHSLQERSGKLWRYFGAIVGVPIPDRVGLIVFFRGLTVGLWVVGFLTISGVVLWQVDLAYGFLGFLVGCRVSDGVFSDILPYNKGYRPNPGLTSVPLYFAEALFLALAFYPGLSQHAVWAVIGFASGALLFYSIIPVLRKSGPRLFGRQEQWSPGTPRPG